MISFIIVAKNESLRIADAINSIISTSIKNYEIIIIDDQSSDDTFKIIKKYSYQNNKIRIFKNKFVGKVQGTNYGYSLATGDILKFFDADDILLPEYFNIIKKVKPGYSHCHAATVVSNTLKPIAKYSVNFSIINCSSKEIVSNLVSLPKWSWTLSREVAKKVFPIPALMPIEDIWISIRSKEFSKKIIVENKSLYLYRQHKGQDYGGILNFNYDIVKLRAQRSKKIIKILKNMPKYQQIDFSYQSLFLKAILNRISVRKILISKFLIKDKFKLILILYLPNLSRVLTKLKWKIDSILTNSKYNKID